MTRAEKMILIQDEAVSILGVSDLNLINKLATWIETHDLDTEVMKEARDRLKEQALIIKELIAINKKLSLKVEKIETSHNNISELCKLINRVLDEYDKIEK